mmetsp:Transcript_10261/g.35929  ORF Transcript_10261/g.35929 Transcript_10261/m.35929 type:complete len:129 (+) Transcript_10261:263-649(+)
MLFKGWSYDVAMSRVEQKRTMIYPNVGFQVQLQYLDRLVAQSPRGNWGDKLSWLRSAVPRGDLAGPGSNVLVREAMNKVVRLQLHEVSRLAEAASNDGTLLENKSAWQSPGLFFEMLQKYEASERSHA